MLIVRTQTLLYLDQFQYKYVYTVKPHISKVGLEYLIRIYV